MLDNQKCSKCGSFMKKIPIKRLDSVILIEFYCDKCDESITYYPDINKIKFERAKFF